MSKNEKLNEVVEKNKYKSWNQERKMSEKTLKRNTPKAHDESEEKIHNQDAADANEMEQCGSLNWAREQHKVDFEQLIGNEAKEKIGLKAKQSPEAPAAVSNDCSHAGGMDEFEDMLTETEILDVELADNDITEDERKIFIGGLAADVSEKSLLQYFEKFGKIEFVNMIKDHFTGSPRGFAFITFTTIDAVEDVLKENTHSINGSVCGSYRAKPRNGRLFVGNLNNHIKDTDIYDYFGKFGKIIRIERSSVPTKSVWFCFVVYQSMDTVKKVLQSEKPVVKNQELNVELARRRTRQSWWVSSANFGAPKQEVSYKRGGQGAPSKATKTIFIGGLSSETDENDLKVHFEAFGKVESVNIVQDRLTQCSRGFGFVDFEKEESVDNVLKKRTHRINGKSCGTRKVERSARKMLKVKPPGVRAAASMSSAVSGMFPFGMMSQTAPMLPPEIMQQMMPAGVSFGPENLPWEVQGLPWKYRPWW